jgi:hypothetical protein
MRDYPHPEDLGLNPEADQTEDLRSDKKRRPQGCNPEAVQTNDQQKVVSQS